MVEIFHFLFAPLVACMTMLGLFGYLGIHVIEREIIFIDIALAQMAALGSAFALVILGISEHSPFSQLLAFGFIIISSLFYAKVGRKISQISIETVIGVSYAIAAAGALFLLAISAGGDVHMEHMLTGSILWARWTDILICLAAFILVGLFHYIFRDKFHQISENYHGAVKSGINTEFWDFLFYITLGLAITLSVQIAGVLVIFSFLIIPSTFAAIFSARRKQRIVIAWMVGTTASIMGLIFSYTLDFSCGPSIVSFLGLFVILGAIFKKLKPASAVRKP